jgi:polysaccharide export outer membrane protein
MRGFAQRILLILALVLAAPVAANGQQQPPPSPSAGEPNSQPDSLGAQTRAAEPALTPLATDANYKLGIGDFIEVAVIGQNEFTTRARIGTDGAILLPLIGATPATNRSPAQLAEDVRASLQKGSFYANPVVRVDVLGVASRFITILGAVGTPGLMPLDRQYRLSQIIARIGGRSGSGADYVVVTSEAGASKQYKLADLATAVGDQDPIVQNGDKIYIPPAENNVFYINGQVSSPGSYPASEGMTVRIAIAKAGGVTQMGNEKKVKINRKGEKLKNVKLDETIVQNGDILTVGERLF